MAEPNSGKLSHSGQTSKIPDFLAAMVAGSYNIQEASRNLSYLQEQTHHGSKMANCITACHHGHQKPGYHSSDYYTSAHFPGHPTPQLRPEDWAMYHPYSALSQCLPVDPPHHDSFLSTYYPVTEVSDTRYDRCSTPDIIQSVLQMDPHDMSPIGKQMTPENHIHSSSAAPTSPIPSLHSSIWKSPGGREYMDSGYLSEDSLPSLSTSAYMPKSVTSTIEHQTKIPAFAPTFFPSMSRTSVPHQAEINKPQKAIKSPTKAMKKISKYPSSSTDSTHSCSYTKTSSPVSTHTKYEPISPVQVSCVSSEVSPDHLRQSDSSTEISPVHIQSSQVSTSEEQLPLVAADVKTQGQSIKRKLSDTDLQSEKTSFDAKRGRHNEPLNQRAIMVMTSWYNSHKENPYPNKEEKLQMAAEGGIRVSQVKSWFANKRNRSNNTRPKVQKQQLQERLLTLCHSLAKDQQPVMDNSFIIQQLSTLITSAQR